MFAYVSPLTSTDTEQFGSQWVGQEQGALGALVDLFDRIRAAILHSVRGRVAADSAPANPPITARHVTGLVVTCPRHATLSQLAHQHIR